MTKRLETLLEEIRALPDERQEEIADILALQLGHVPEWHREILRERVDDMERNPDEGIPLDQVVAEMRSRWNR